MAEQKSERKVSVRKPGCVQGKLEAPKWYVVDANGKVLGRLATQIASILIGKGKKTYVPYWENGDHVVVINAAKIRVTGKKGADKMYDHYTGYPGGRREYSFDQLMEKDPREIVLRAVEGMIPKNRLGVRMMKRLRIFAGAEYTHQAQQPTPVQV